MCDQKKLENSHMESVNLLRYVDIEINLIWVWVFSMSAQDLFTPPKASPYSLKRSIHTLLHKHTLPLIQIQLHIV